jgi:hypothetical protein
MMHLSRGGLAGAASGTVLVPFAILAGLHGTHAAGNGGMSSMGPMRMASLTAWTGYYDKHKVEYISTDTSSKAEATRDHINYSAALAKSLSSASFIYLPMNGKFAGHGAVFGSQPGEDDYTPLWREVQVSWVDPTQAVALGSDDQIKDLAKAGKVRMKMTGVVLNCPIIKVMAGGM